MVVLMAARHGTMATMSGGTRPTVSSWSAVASPAGLPIPGSDGDPAAPTPRASAVQGAAVIVGRESELARLAALRDAAFAGQAGTVLLAGEAGVGKTSIASAFITATRDADPDVRVVRGECVPLGGEGLPYAPVVGMLHDLADLFGETELLERAGAGAAELCWLIPEFGPGDHSVDGTRPENRLRLFETVSRLVEDAARRNPLIIFVEDVHWADESSRHLIDFLIRAVSGVPALIMISYRTDELTRRHPLRPFLAEIGRVPTVHRIEVGPLSPTAVEQLITISRPDPAEQDHDHHRGDLELIKRVALASGGIPYFVVELIRAGQSGGELPQTLRDTLLLRISRVGEDCQRLLRLMAVGGNRVEHAMVAAVSELPDVRLEQNLREATEAALIIPDKTGYAFRHALMREVLHDDLLPGELTRLHRTYARALEQHPDLMPDPVRAVQLAHHWYAARDNPAAFRWSVAAARLQRYGYAEALRHYERALALWEVVPEPEAVAGPLPEFLDDASMAANDAGDADRSLALLNEALRVAGPNAGAEATALRVARKARRMLNLLQPGVLELMDQAIALVPSDRPTVFLARLQDYRASIQLLLDKPAAVASARIAIETAAAAGDPDIESSARNTLGCTLATLGIDADEGLAQLRRAGELASSDMTRTRYYINLSDTLTLLGRPRDGAAVASEGQELADRVGLTRHSGVMMAGNAAEAAIELGEWDRARELVSSALRAAPTGNHWLHHRRLLAVIRLWMDDDLDAVQEILTDLGRFGQIAVNGPQYHAGISSVRAELALARNDPVGAWQIVQETVEASGWSEPVYDIRVASVAAVAYGRNPERPAGWAEWLTGRLRDLPSAPVSDQLAPFIRGELEGTVAGWRRAVEEMSAAHTPPHLIGYGRLRLAEHEDAAGLPADGLRSARAARELGEQLGLPFLVHRVDELGPGGAHHQGNEDSPLTRLTSREREVLGLVADGLSNKQIGERLVISGKTASVHVSNILAKLAVGSRGEAAARFRMLSS